MNNEQEGPRIYTQPVFKRTVCNGCKYLEQTAGLRSHTEHRDNYACLHPESIKGEIGKPMSILGLTGRVINYNMPFPCVTPSWCPFLKPKQNEITEKP